MKSAPLLLPVPWAVGSFYAFCAILALLWMIFNVLGSLVEVDDVIAFVAVDPDAAGEVEGKNGGKNEWKWRMVADQPACGPATRGESRRVYSPMIFRRTFLGRLPSNSP